GFRPTIESVSASPIGLFVSPLESRQPRTSLETSTMRWGRNSDGFVTRRLFARNISRIRLRIRTHRNSIVVGGRHVMDRNVRRERQFDITHSVVVPHRGNLGMKRLIAALS